MTDNITKYTLLYGVLAVVTFVVSLKTEEYYLRRKFIKKHSNYKKLDIAMEDYIRDNSNVGLLLILSLFWVITLPICIMYRIISYLIDIFYQ